MNSEILLNLLWKMCQYTCFTSTDIVGIHLRYQIFMQVSIWATVNRLGSSPAETIVHISDAAWVVSTERYMYG